MRAGSLVAVLVLLSLPLGGCGRERKAREARAVAYADTVAAAYGGPDAWRALRFVRFDLSVRDSSGVRTRFRHLWNLGTGDCRYEGDLAALRDLPRGPEAARRLRGVTLPDGKLVAVVNRGTGKGMVRVEEGAGAAPPEDALLALARDRVEEDGLWLFLPFLLRDPGVTLSDLGSVTAPASNRPARALLMKRKGDRRTVTLYIDPETNRILETETPAPDGAPRRFQWRSEVLVGGIRLVAERRETETRSMIYDLMAAPERIAPEVFTDLTRRMPY